MLIGFGYSSRTYYKLKSTIYKKPDVLALGTSRILQFRSRFFADTYKFYNAGRAITNLSDFRKFLREIPKEKQPKLLIMDLNQHFFNEHSIIFNEDMIDKALLSGENRAEIFGRSWKKIYKDIFSKKLPVLKLLETTNKPFLIGMNAKIRNRGFKHDGSYLYGDYINDPSENEDFQFRNTFERIAEGKNRFEYGEKVSEKAIDELKLFLNDCSERGIYVIGFLPPFAHAVYERLKSMGKKYDYIFKLEEKLKPVLEEKGFAFYNFSDLMWVGASDKETIGGFHASEKAQLRLFIKMLESNNKLKRYSADISFLEERLRNSKSDFDVFYYEF